MKKIVSLFMVILSFTFFLIGCDSSNWAYVSCKCSYSSERIEIPVWAYCTYNGGVSSEFKSKKLLSDIKKKIENKQEKGVVYKTELFMDSYLFIKMYKNDIYNYALLVLKKRENEQNFYILNDMSTFLINKRFLIPYHLITDERVINNFFGYLYNYKFDLQEKYEIDGDINMVYDFYYDTNAFIVEKEDNNLKVTVDNSKVSNSNNCTVNISFFIENEKTFISFDIKD